eukprot:scaffold2950_cov93-Skeletonema_menzelii.AAC.14
MANPSPNDVLSGRGVSFNRHPGNENFRRLLDEQSNDYGSGTKKQKMAISKSIVESIYSMDPPGRFLKKCPNGGWEELSMKEAATRTSQAMAYAVRERAKQKRELRSHRLKSDKASSHAAKDPRLPSYVNVHNARAVSASSARAFAPSGRGGEADSDADSSSESNEGSGKKSGGNNEPPLSSSLQQQLLQLQHQTNTALPANSGAPLNGLVQLLAQAQLQQQQQQQQQQEQLLRQLLGQIHQLGLQTQLPSASLPSTLSMPAPSLAAQGTLLSNINNDILRQASATLPQSSALMNLLQQPNLLQNQAQSQSSPLNGQSLLGLMSMLQNQSQPASRIPPQLPSFLSQQLNPVQQNPLNQVQQNQLLASLLTQSSPSMLQQQPQSLNLLQQLQSQPLNLLQQQATLLQQQMAQNPSTNFASNSESLTEANAASTSKEQGGGEEEQNSD